jgi:syntaxin 7
LLAFQRAQQLSAERQRTVVESVRVAAEEEESSLNEGSSVTQRQAQQVFQQRPSPHELAHQEHLIREREQDIREVETGIHELAEIFHDLRTFVIGQGDMLGTFLRLRAILQERLKDWPPRMTIKRRLAKGKPVS